MSIKQILSSAIATPAAVVAKVEPEVALEDFTMNDALHAADMDSLEAETAIEITTDAIVGLESLSDAVTACQDNGGMDSQSAALLAASIETVMAPFGGATSQALPSQEAYEGDGGRAVATTAALEGIAKTLSDMWKGLVAMLQRAQKAMMAWLSKVFDRLGRMKATALAIAKKADAAKGEYKGTELSVQSPDYIYTDGKADGFNPAAIKKAFAKNQLIDVSTFSNSSVMNAVKDGKVTNEAEAKSLLKDLADSSEALKKEILGSTKLDKGKDGRLSGKGDYYTDDADMYPGGAMLIAAIVDGKAPKMSFILPLAKPNMKDKKEKALTASEVSALCKEVANGCQTMIDAKGEMKKVEDSLNSLQKAGEKLVNTASDSLGKDGTKAVKEVMSTINATVTGIRNSAQGSFRYGTKLLESAIAFSKASVADLEKAKPATEDNAGEGAEGDDAATAAAAAAGEGGDDDAATAATAAAAAEGDDKGGDGDDK